MISASKFAQCELVIIDYFKNIKAVFFLVSQDDPFSALDAHVGKHVFEEAIMNRMLKKRRTVILTTHQLQYLSYASHVSIVRTFKL